MSTETKTKAYGAEMECLPGERAFIAKITSDALDRDREVLLPDGMDATDFQKNPVVFFAHDYDRLPVGKVTALKRRDDHWLAKVVLAERPANHVGEWVPDTILALIQQGIIGGVSVGFEPTQIRNPTAEDRKRFGEGVARVFARWKLLELSIAPLPANQEALIEAVSKAVHAGNVSRSAVKACLGVEVPEPKAAKVSVPVPEPRKRVKVPVVDWKQQQARRLAASDHVKIRQTVELAVREAIAKARGELWV